MEHEEWMTDLPPELRMTGEDATKQRKFLTKSKKERGDTSAWTDTPAQREQRQIEKMLKQAEMEQVPSFFTHSQSRHRSSLASGAS